MVVHSIHHDNPITTIIIALRDGLVLVLPGGIPDLQLQLNSVHIHNLIDEVYADGHDVVLCELAASEPQQQVALAHSRISNYDGLEQIVEGLLLNCLSLHNRLLILIYRLSRG